MALANFTLAAAGATPAIVPTTAAPLRVDLDDLLYSPEQAEYPPQPGHEPYAPPANQQRRSKLRKRAGAAYLPPPNQYTHYPHDDVPRNPYNGQIHTQVYQQHARLDLQIQNQRVQGNPQFDNTGQYVHDPTGDYDYEQRRLNPNGPPRPFGGFADAPYPAATTPPSSRNFDAKSNQNVNTFNFASRATPPTAPPLRPSDPGIKPSGGVGSSNNQPPDRPRGFTKVETGSSGSGGKTQLHAVLDYDDDYYDDVPGPDAEKELTVTSYQDIADEEKEDIPLGQEVLQLGNVNNNNESGGAKINNKTLGLEGKQSDNEIDNNESGDSGQPAVTPLQGPILLRNGTVPVVPLTSYPTVNNGSFYQIPILWTALSVALGYELQGQIIRGVPCVKRNFQLYCPTAGNTYPLDKIENFIDENKALIKRMYGSFATPGGNRVRRAPGVPDMDVEVDESFFRPTRQASNTQLPDAQSVNSTGRIDACESKTEIMTPYWALNSGRKLRAIVNTMHFEQAIHQEVCSKKSTARCSSDCGCEQKYKWHRLLAYDPNDDCAGIFMDWFLFPSCCVCRCNP